MSQLCQNRRITITEKRKYLYSQFQHVFPTENSFLMHFFGPLAHQKLRVTESITRKINGCNIVKLVEFIIHLANARF